MSALPAPTPLQRGHLHIDLEARTVHRDATEVELSNAQWSLLRVMCNRPSYVFPKAELERKAFDAKFQPRSRRVDTHMSRLRGLLGAPFVINVWGVGYKLVAPEDAARIHVTGLSAPPADLDDVRALAVAMEHAFVQMSHLHDRQAHLMASLARACDSLAP